MAHGRGTFVMKTVWRVWLVVALMGVLGTACNATATTTDAAPTTTVPIEPKHGGKLVYGIEADPNGLDPTKNGWDASGLMLANAIYDPLVALDATGAWHPYLAQSLTPLDGGRIWRVKLRPGVRFHNGEKLNADSLAASTAHFKASAITGPITTYIDSTNKIDDLTIDVKMAYPFPNWPMILTGQGGMIPSVTNFDDPNASTHPVGTGPFRVKEWKPGEYIKLERNPDYWQQGLPYLDQVEFRPIPSDTDRMAALQRGDIDVLHTSNDGLVSQLTEQAANGSMKLIRDTGEAEKNFVMFNMDNATLADPRVRQAVVLATDRDAYFRANGTDPRQAIDGPYSSASPFYESHPQPAHDLARAKALVAEVAKERGPIRFTLTVANDPNGIGAAQALIDSWNEAGMDVTMHTIDRSALPVAVVVGGYAATVFRYLSEHDPVAENYFFTSQTAKPDGQISTNMSKVKDDVLDQAVAAGEQSDDPAVRKAAYGKLQARLAELNPFVWLGQTQWVIAETGKIENLENNKLPDGATAQPMQAGVHRLTQTWIDV